MRMGGGGGGGVPVYVPDYNYRLSVDKLKVNLCNCLMKGLAS